nr:transmembrane protein 144 homolog [Lytechinus pictus]
MRGYLDTVGYLDADAADAMDAWILGYYWILGYLDAWIVDAADAWIADTIGYLDTWIRGCVDAADTCSVFFQWIMCSGVWFVGLMINLFRSSPTFYPLSMLGGFLWASGNVMVVPILKTIGLGPGLLIWSSANMISGWASGQFGWFGLNKDVLTRPTLNYIGFALAFMRTALLSHGYVSKLLSLYVFLFLPGLDYVFAHYCGIYATSTAYFLIYSAYMQNKPQYSERLVLPSMVCGMMWAVAQAGWFVANTNLTESVAFPIVTTGPSILAALWSVFYFREIRGLRNYILLVIAFIVATAGVVCTALSKV